MVPGTVSVVIQAEKTIDEAKEEDTTTTTETEDTTETAAQDETVTETTESEITGDFEYTIKWGDTLWDLSATFYRDPFQYPVIANYEKNNIADPDLIFANTKIFIPEK